MKGFEDVTLKWAGEAYVVPANRQLMLIAEIEDALAGHSGQQAVQVLLTRSGPSYSRLAQAYGAALRYAGANVTDEEIYLAIQSDMAEGDAKVAIDVQGYVMGLLAIISPPIAKKFQDFDAPEKPKPGAGKKKAKASSEQSTD